MTHALEVAAASVHPLKHAQAQRRMKDAAKEEVGREEMESK